MTAFATTGSLGSAQLEPNRNSGLQSLVETRPMPSASIREAGRRRRWVLCLALILVVSLTGIGRAQDLVPAEAFDDLVDREEVEIASAGRSVPPIPPPFLPPEIAQLPLSVITAAPPRQPANVPALGDDPVTRGDLGIPSDPVLGPGSVQHPVGRPLAENVVVQISETLLPDGSFSVETNIQANLDLAAIVTAKARPFIVAPTVVERGPGYRIIESISREAGKNGSDLLKTNRYTIRGELQGEETLPGVRTSSIQPPTVVEAGEHYKRVESITEFLDLDGSRILKTNSFVEFDSDAARAAALTNLDVLHWSSHQKVVRRQIPEHLANGRLRLTSSTYTELGAGIAYQDEKGQWRDSVPQFEILPDGSGVSARQIPHKVLLKSNPNAEDPVQITLPDGTLLKSRVLGLGYFDRTSGKSVTIASLKDSAGQLNEARNEVVFPDAFQGVSASIRLVLSSGGIEQDIILDESPGRPEDYDKSFNSETSELEVITEFFPEKEPLVTRQVVQKAAPEAALAMAEPELTDEIIDFSGMEIGHGRAFSLENAPGESRAAEVGVRKRWQTIEGRTILFEAVSYPELKTLTSKLPDAAPVKQKPRAATGRTLPARQLARTGSGNAKVQVARASLPRRGVVLDYALAGTATNVTLSSGTYLVKAPITLTGNTVIQGGVVVKEASAASITLKDTVTCQTSSSAKAYFVSVNDNTVGEMIVPGAPVGVYAYQAINLSSVNGGTTLSYLEIRNATYGVAVDNSSVAINNCRFVDCNYAIQGHYSTVTSLNLSYCGGADWTFSGASNSSTYTPTNPIADCASPCAGDDHGNRPSQATPISLGASTAGTINCSGDEDFLFVNVSSPGNLVVYTTGSTDTYGHLLDSKGYELMSDDDGAVDRNFRISYPVSPGAYYIRVRHKSGGAGSYQLQAYISGPTLISGISSFAGLRNNYSGWVGLQFAVGSAPVWVSDLGRWIVSGNSQTHTVKLFDAGGVALNGGSVQIDTSGKPPGQFAYASLPQPIMLAANTIYVLMSLETDGGDQWYNNTGTSVTLDPVAGNAYGAFSSSLPFYQTYTAGASYVPVDLKFAAANVSDDYGNSIGTAATAALNSNISGQLNYGGDNDFFRIVVGSSGYLTIYTTGATDTYGYLLDSSGNELNHNDDNPYPNFAITRFVSAGTYYAQVRSFSGGTGSYVFRADFSASQPPAVSAPSFNAPSFNSDHTVATVSATSQAGATVCYSLDGSDPTSSYSTVPPSVSSTYAVVKARAFQAGYSASAVTPMTPIPKAGPVSFSPANHSAIQYANGPLAVTMTAVPGATISYVETGSYWKTTTSGSSPSFDGMGAGSGIIQAYAFTPTTLRGDTTYSGTYYFRAPQPTSSVAYPTAPATSATLTLNTLPGATLDLYLAGSGSPVSLVADNTGVATRTVPSATRIRVKARKPGYVDSGFITAHVNRLNAPKLAVNGVILSPGTINLSGSSADVWILPDFGFNNAYGEIPDTSGWNNWNVAWNSDKPADNFPGSFKGNVAGSSVLYSAANVDISYGRTYTMAGYYRKEQAGGGCDYAGVYNFADDGTPVSADDVNDQHYAATYLIAPLVDGATSAQVANTLTFANLPPEYYYNIFTPLLNFSQTASVQRDNQPDVLSDVFQYQDVSTASMKVIGVNGNTLTLQNPYHGPTLNAGTAVCRRDSGGWWQYQLIYCDPIPLTWTYKFKEFSYLRSGTTSIEIGSLLYSGNTKVTGVEFWEGTLAQRPKLHFRTDGSSDVFSLTGQTAPVKLSITGSTTITVGQRGDQYLDSSVPTYNLTFPAVAAKPEAARALSPPASGVKQVWISATTATTPQDIRYTTGSDPVPDTPLPLVGTRLPAAATVKLEAFKSGYTPSPMEVSVNQPPVLIFGQGPNNAYSDQLAGVEYLLFVQVTGGTGSLTDSDSYNFGYGELRVVMNSPTASDQLRCHPSRNGLTFVPAASGDPNVTPGEIRDAAGKVGSFVGGYGGTALVITFDVNASPGLAQDVLLGIGYRYSGTVIASTARPFTVTAKDGDGGTTTKSGTLNVVPSGSLTLTAGPDQTVTIGRVVELAGYLNNRAVLTGPGLTVAWEKVSGPGDVSFANAGSSFTHSGFGLPGEYELKLSVDKDGTVVADTIKITVLPVNPALVVNAGPDRTLSAGTLPTTFQAESSVVGNSLPPVYSATWSKIDGPPGSSVTFTSRGISGQPDKVTASFSDVGTYTLRLDVVDGTRSGGDEVTIRLCSGVQRPLDLMLAIDTSGSMLNGARLESAKAGVLDLLGRLAGEGIAVKVGAVAFTDNPCQFLPLTTDINVAKQFVKSLEVTPFSLTSLKDGLLRAKQELLGPRRTGTAGQPSTYSMPLIVVVSDGLLSLRDTAFPGCLFYPFGNASDIISVANNIKPLITIATISATEKVADTEVLNWTMCNDTYYQQTYADAMNLLRDVASPGLFREIQSASDIKDAVGSILDGICRGQSASEVPGPGNAVMTAVANCDRFVVQEDSRQNVLNVLLNDDQRSGHSYQVALAQDASPHGKVSLGAANGTFNYDPSPNYSWTMGDSTPDTFTYTLLEDGQQVGTATVTVWVSPVNDPPQASDDKYVVASSSSGPVTLPVLDNDTDPDINPANATQYDELQIVALSPLDPAAGSIAIVPDGKHLSFTRVAGSGTYAFTYTIRDSRGLESTARVTLQIGGSGLQPILKPDARMVLRGLQNVRIDVLANDQNPALDGSTLTITTVVRDPLDNVANPSRGTLAVESGGHAVLFTSDGQVGTMAARYDVTGAGGAVASAVLTITVVDELNLNQPPVALDDLNYATIENSTPGFPMIIVPVLGNDSDPEGDVLTIATWTQGSHGATVTKLSNPERLQYNPGTYRGSDSFTYVVADQKGNRSTARVTVHVKASGNAAPQADIWNMGRDTATYPETPVTPANSTDRPEYRDQILVVKDATLQVKGTALDANAPPVGNDFFQYTLTLSRLARDSEAPAWKSPFEVQRIVGNTQVQAGAVLGTFDLSTLPNGSYFVELNVQGGADFATPVQRRFILDNQLKLGDFTFTVEDLNVPVEGVPLSVQRTYSSLDANAGKGGDFGPGWKYSLIDLDVELDEMREEVEELVQFSPSRETFSKRVNPDGPSAMSGRNVTLTLPDGRRTTFYFSPKIDNAEQKVIPMWKTLPGVGARLELLDWQNGTYTGNEYIGIPTLKWAANGHVALDGYDIRGFKLILADGTEYTMLREDLGWHEYSNVSNPTVSDIGVQAWGKPYVSEIKLKSGERLVFDGQGVSAFLGSTLRKSLRIERENGRITAIYDPLDPQGTPALIYTYDEKGDLREVKQRVKRTSVGNAEYLTTKYFYDDPQRPHFLTAIVDPRGKRIAQNTYDAKGRLKTQTDAAGVTVTSNYDSPVLGGSNEATRSLNQAKGKLIKSVLVTAGVPMSETQESVTAYDSQGNVVYQKSFDGIESGYSYDSRGTVTEERQYHEGVAYTTSHMPVYGTDSATAIDYLQKLTTVLPYESGPNVNVADFTIVQTFYPSGELKKTVAPNGAVQVQELDAAGRFSKLFYNQDAAGNGTGATLMEQTYPSTGVGSSTELTLVGRKNDANRTPVYTSFSSDNTLLYSTGAYPSTDPLGRPIMSTFDTNLRLTALTTDQGASTSGYDDLGRETTTTFAGITTAFQYGSNPDWSSLSGPTVGNLSRTIDDTGRLQGWTPPTGRSTGYAYDERGRLIAESDGAGNLTVRRFAGDHEFSRRPGLTEVDVTKDDLGRPTARYSHDFGRDTYEYYPDGRLKALHHQIAGLFGTAHSPGFSGQSLQPSLADWTFAYPIVRADAAPSKTQVKDPLQRTSTQEFSKEGLLKSTTGNSCCGNLQFSYLLDNPELDAEDYPTLITDQANRVRAFSYYLDPSTDGNIGQLHQVTELANAATTARNYTFKYFKPDLTPFTTQLKSVDGPSSSAATGRQTLLQYTYDTNDRLLNTTITGLSGTHDSLTGTRSITYGTTTLGAVHLPSKITSPNGLKVELAYETGTGRVQTKYLERAAQTSANAEEQISYFYDANDSLARTEQLNRVQSTIRSDVVKMLQGRLASIGSGNTVLAGNHQLQEDDPVQFSTTGTLPTGLTSGTIYYVLNRTDSGFQVSTTPGSSAPVTISQNGSGLLSISDGPGWSAIVQSEINTARNRAELTHRRWPVKSGQQQDYDGWYEEVGVRRLPSANGIGTYLSKYSFNSAQQLQAIDVYCYLPSSNAENRPVRKLRIEFLRDAAGRLLARTAFKVASNYPDDDSLSSSLTPIVEAVYTYYTNPDNSARNGDWIRSIEHRKYVSGSPVTLEKAIYERSVTGEPTKVTWNDTTYVTVSYNPADALRIASEDFSAGAGVEKAYTYHDSGNRGALNGSAWTYNSGYQLSSQGGKTYSYDGNGNLSSITASPNVTLGYTVDDRLNTLAKVGSPTMTYWYDASGHRTKATDGTTNRRFIWGPVPGSDLDVIHMVTGDDDSVKSVYIYAGNQPVARFGINSSTGDIDMSTLRFYLEDAMGSVLGLADQTGALTARFRYDGFGNPRTDAGLSAPAVETPNGTGGDFRFHGAWFETASGLYHMRARDYDPETGRFIERDPVDPNPEAPETYNSYVFANSNPYYFSDPSGEFTVVEMNIGTAIQNGLQGLRTVAIEKAKSELTLKAFDAFAGAAQNALGVVYPGYGAILNIFKEGPFAAGKIHESRLVQSICAYLPSGLQDEFWIDPLISADGTPASNGLSCGARHLPLKQTPKGVARPDFVLGPTAPTDLHFGGYSKEYLIGDFKLSGNSLYNQYVEGNRQTQFKAIANFAGKHTETRSALFITIYRGDPKKYESVKKAAIRLGLQNGTILWVLPLKK